MIKSKTARNPLKHISPGNLYERINQFMAGMSVTKGSFELLVERCTLVDIEWNHMDQQHRPSIHNTYEKGLRIALGSDFAISLTQWAKWPFFITVTDVYVDRGLFYQSLTLAGIIFIHSVISMEERNDSVLLKHEWYMASHKFFRFLHKPIDKKLLKLNVRLQQEDEQLRQGRFELRQQGFTFRSDPPNYNSSNTMSANTIYPQLDLESFFSVDDVTSESFKKVGKLEFIVKKDESGSYLIWPAVCPHEGGPLKQGKICNTHIICPWHSLRFAPVKLSCDATFGAKYGFEYMLMQNKVYVKQMEYEVKVCEELLVPAD